MVRRYHDDPALPAQRRDVAVQQIDAAAVQSAVGLVFSGGTLSTDTEGDGATPLDPVETTVTVPADGFPAIAEVPAGSASGGRLNSDSALILSGARLVARI